MGLAHDRGWRVFSLPIAKTRRPVKDAIGYPDLTLAKGGEVIWLELKGEHGVISTAQRSWLADLPSACVVTPQDWESGLIARLLG